MALSAKTIFRDYVTDGVPSSGPNKPKKSEIREWGSRLETGASGWSYETVAAASADTIPSTVGVINILTGDRTGIFTRANTGSADTFTSVGGVTWYRDADVIEARIVDKAISRRTLDDGLRAVSDYAEPTCNLELLSDSGWRIPMANPGSLSGRVMQGWTFVTQTAELYSVSVEGGTDFVDSIATVVRHDRYGAIIDQAAGELLTLGHAQGLESLYYNGTLTFLSQNGTGNGVTAFEYVNGGGQPLANKRNYILSDAGTYKHTTIGLSADKRVLNAYYRKESDGKSYVTQFDVATLLAGPTGDRRGTGLREICLTDNPAFDGTSANNEHGQGVTSDANYIYTLNGYFQIGLPKYLYVFRISDGKLAFKKEVTSGKAKAATMGGGTTYEPEDLEWIQGGLGTAPQLWMGMRVGGAPNNNWIVPLGAYGGGIMVEDKYPGGAGMVFRAGPHDIVKLSGQALQVSDFNDGVMTNVGGMRANNQWYGDGFRWGVADGVELFRVSATEITYSKGSVVSGALRKRIGVTATTLTISSDGTDSGAAYHILPSTASAAVTVNLPQDALVGHEFEIASSGTGVTTLTATGGATINGGATKAITNNQLYLVVCTRNQTGTAAQWKTRA